MIRKTSGLALAAVLVGMLATPAQAINSNFGDRAVRNLNSEGYARCQSLGRSGYTATASGISESGTGPGSGTFRIRSCFATRSQCERFLVDLPRLVGKIDTFRHRTCKPRF